MHNVVQTQSKTCWRSTSLCLMSPSHHTCKHSASKWPHVKVPQLIRRCLVCGGTSRDTHRPVGEQLQHELWTGNKTKVSHVYTRFYQLSVKVYCFLSEGIKWYQFNRNKTLGLMTSGFITPWCLSTVCVERKKESCWESKHLTLTSAQRGGRGGRGLSFLCAESTHTQTSLITYRHQDLHISCILLC